MIPYGRQDIDEDDIAAVAAVLRSHFLTQGPAVPQFERAIADYCGARHAVAVNSATSALHLACLALGVGPGDLVWTSAITFVASANCARYCGASVDFVDIDPRSFNMSVSALGEKLAAASRGGTLPKVVIPVHLAGQSCDMAAIHKLSQQYGFRVIEDASHAIGGRYRGAAIGGGRFADVTVFSFHPVKIVTTGEGGVALTNDEALARMMALLRSHGITRDEAEMTCASAGPWYYEQLALGFNYRMTDMQAALGSSQMRRLDSLVGRRRTIARFYDEALAGCAAQTPWQHPDTDSAYHLYIIRMPGSQREAFTRLRDAGIGVNLHYIPVYLQPYYRGLGFAPGHCPEAERYYRGAISIPIHPGLSEADQVRVVTAVMDACRA